MVRKGNFGGVAMEYLVVSLVTLAMSFAAVKIVKKSVQSKLEELNQGLSDLPIGESDIDELFGR